MMAQPASVSNTAITLPFHIGSLPSGIRYTKRAIGHGLRRRSASSMKHPVTPASGDKTAAHRFVPRGGSINASTVAKNGSKYQPN